MKPPIKLTVLLAIIFGSLFLANGAYIYSNGKRSIDAAYNIRWLNCNYDLNLYDRTTSGELMTYTEIYSMGTKQIDYGFMFATLGAFLIGVSITIIEVQR